MSHHDLDAERRTVDPKQTGPTFTLAKQDFTCLPALPGATLNRAALAIRVDDKGRQVYNAPNVIAFIEECLITRRWIAWEFEGEEAAAELSQEQRDSITDEQGYWETADDRSRFLQICEGTDDIVELETLVKCMNNLMEDYGERPTRRSKR